MSEAEPNNFEMPKPVFKNNEEGVDAHFGNKAAKLAAELEIEAERQRKEDEIPTARDLDQDVLAKAEEAFNKKPQS
jgi:hypothetical protein